MESMMVSKSSSSMLLVPKPPLFSVRTQSLIGFQFLSQRRRRTTIQLENRRRRCRSSSVARKVSNASVVICGIREIDEAQFSETVLKSDGPVLVEFVATWCGPCRLVAPAIEWVAQEYKDKLTVVKIDHDANPKLIEEYKVYGLPALILFKNGKEVPESRREGAITKAKLKEYLEPLLDSKSVV